MDQGQKLWKKRILVPFWIVRICLMLFIIVINAYTLRTLKDIEDFTQPATGYANTNPNVYRYAD